MAERKRGAELMAQQRHRIARKATKVAVDELDRRFNVEFGVLVKERDEANMRINKEYRAAVEAADDQRKRDRKAIGDQFAESRKVLLKKLNPDA
jgi:hypothetical protein